MNIRLAGPLFVGLFVLLISGCSPDERGVTAGEQQDTLRVALLGLEPGGIGVSEAESLWASGLRGLLLALIESHPRIDGYDRVSGPVFGQQVRGADYVISGEFFLNDEKTFSQLDLRVTSVKSGRVMAQMHVPGEELHQNRVTAVLESFVHQFARQAGASTARIPLAAPCGSEALDQFVAGFAARDSAIAAKNPEKVIALLNMAAAQLTASATNTCTTGSRDWLEFLVVDVKERLSAIEQQSPVSNGNR